MSRSHALRIAAASWLAAVMVAVLAMPADAASLSPGALRGTWRLQVTVVSFGAPGAANAPTRPGGTSINPLVPPVGHTGTVVVTFTPQCANGACTLDITPGPGANAGFTNSYSPTGFALPPPGTGPNILSGDRLGFPGFAGFGGPCRGIRTPFEYELIGHVTSTSTVNGTAQVATLSGQEQIIALSSDCSKVQRVRLSFSGTNISLTTASSPATPGPASTPRGAAAGTHQPRVATGQPLNRRSTLAATLDTPGRIFGSPARDLVNVGIALAVMLFITFPANLFNKTFQENYADITAFWERRLGRVGKTLQALQDSPNTLRHRIGYVVTIVCGALLGLALNPHSALDLATGTNFGATLATIALSTLIGFAVSVAYRRMRGLDVQAKVQALPGGLLVAAGCVVVSRLVEFRPGYLYGVVAGVAFAAKMGRREDGQLIALSHLTTICIAVFAWLLWVPVNHAAAHPGSSLAIVGLDDVLGALFVGGLVGGTISLIPLSFMPGHALAAWHKGAWSATFGITLFGLLAAMLNPRSTNVHPGHAPVVTAILLLGAFGGGSAVFAAYWTRKRARGPRPPEPEAPAPPAPATDGADVPADPPPVPRQRRPRTTRLPSS